MQDTCSGWDWLKSRDYEKAVRDFHARISGGGGDFSDYWGLGKASFFVAEERGMAGQYLKEAFSLALKEWKEGGIPYDIVEAIEKDLDRAEGSSGERILQRGREYILGLLRLTGAMPLLDAVAGVEKLANLKLVPWWDRLLEEIERDPRLIISSGDIVCLPEVKDPLYILEARKKYEVAFSFGMDDLARALHFDLWQEVKQGLESVLNSFSGGNLESEQVIRIALNSRTLSELLQQMDLLTRMYDLRYVMSNWYRVLYNLWVQMPRWEFGFKSLADIDADDMLLGEIKVNDVARILGLVADEEGNLFCPKCGEKVALAEAHHHLS
ncbi:MAG: hypothetical protein HPY90_09095 [Syntrophothermus sp.]|uniref:hypothetical protein n=1 Tax=Syntrophothermus sp. TaxID=2736299 RepID=UPI00257E54ED|nr:hypothetical protein [Syntrophothermus sp.]NSW83415.1 hypothetical protein [Syntrophothermus sp.]